MKQKNRLSVFIIVIFSFFFEIYSQQWVNISPFPETNIGIYGEFISATEGWIMQSSSAEEQAIYHTNDGGKNWEKIFTQSHQLGYFTMVDQNNGWLRLITAEKHLYMKTSDGGYNWNDMTEYMPIESDANYPFYFIDQDVGFICSGADSLDYSATIYKTSDGGYNWYETNTHPFIYNDENHPYGVEKFYFLNQEYGWASCFGWIDEGLSIYTTDGGENWYSGLNPEHNYIADIHFVSPNVGGAVTYFPSYNSIEIMITNDNFSSIRYFYDETDWKWNQYPRAICFQNDSTVWIAGEPGIISRSNNGGANFDSLQTINANLYKIQFFGDIGYIFGNNNNALYRYDGESGIEQECNIDNCLLFQNYPNPFNSTTIIEYFIKENNQVVSLKVYDITGSLVNEIFQEKKHNKGKYIVSWGGNGKYEKEVSNGIYFYRLDVEKQSVTKSMLLLK